MNFVSELRDALYVNWAIPAATLPVPRAPLQLDTLRRVDLELGFVTLVLFRQYGLRRAGWLWPRLSFPQCNFRLLVRDDERVASIFFLRQLVPAWVVPFARGFGRQPATAALFEACGAQGAEIRWTIAAGRRLSLIARPGAPPVDSLVPGGWPETVAFFRERPRGYVEDGRGLRRLLAEHPAHEAIPMRVEVTIADWLIERLPAVPADCWLQPHSAFLVPSLQLSLAVEAGHDARRAAPLPATESAATS